MPWQRLERPLGLEGFWKVGADEGRAKQADRQAGARVLGARTRLVLAEAFLDIQRDPAIQRAVRALQNVEMPDTLATTFGRHVVKFRDEERAEIAESLRRYFDEKLEQRLSNIESNFLLEYIEKEIAPLAYNQGVQDARDFLAKAAEDITGTCFEEPMRYWESESRGARVRRKPNS